MAINKKLIHFKTKNSFNRETSQGNILDNSIVFIQDSKEISTHGTLYKTVNWSILDPFNGHEYVDLGLPSGTLWASCNVGADSPEEYGGYYAWGEIEPKPSYNNYNSVTYGLYISELKSRGIIDADNNLTAEHDAATANWGGSWRMPTLDEMKELLNNCTWEWTTQNGVNGYKVTGTNGNSIFLPAAGYRSYDSLSGAGSYGRYWSAKPNSSSLNTNTLCFSSDLCEQNSLYRDKGMSVRPVTNLNN